jgi:PAS domain S-box-containing protein
VSRPSSGKSERGTLLREYALVIASVAATTLLRLSLNPLLHKKAAFIIFFPALVFSAWVGGWGGGLLALALSTVLAICLFVSPTHALSLPEQADQLTLVIFIIVGLSVSAISNSQRRARRQAMTAAEEAQRSEAAFRKSEARYGHLLETANEGVLTVDAEDRISYANPRMAQILGSTPEELRGTEIYELIFPEDIAATRARRDQRRQGAQEQYEVRMRRRDGGEVWTQANITVQQEEGRFLGTFGLFTDITERRKAESDRQRLLEEIGAERIRLRLALLSGRLGTWHLDITTGEFLDVSYACRASYGLSPDMDFSYAALLAAIHPDDRASVIEAVEGAISGQTDYDAEYRVFWPDGSLHWVAASGAPLTDTDGTVARMIGITQDITERKQAEALLQAQAEREHVIAEQLQAALQPVIPPRVSGMELADYYRPALAEAGVGGDFSDVFSDDKGITFLVVGDLSGKGLAAASQVATVRNMLRFALYNGRTVVGPVSSLNNTLAENGLLTGFATLFVGRYDSAARTLTYVNCGQEPALVKRTETGIIEELSPTGPILGGDSDAIFDERVIALAPGDSLTIFTDGLTEVGPTRRELLGVEGVCGILGSSPPFGQADELQLPQDIVSRLVHDVDDYAQGGSRDDVCLLVGVAI